MSTNNPPIRFGLFSCILAFGLAGTGLQAQTNTAPAATATNLPPATPPLVAGTNGIKLSNYNHPLTDVRRMPRRDDPKSSAPPERHFDWWPRFGRNQQGTNDWIEYDFAEPSTISESKVYWYQDIPRGGCAVPVSWDLVYKDGDQWKPVETTGTYTVSTNAYDTITFKPVTTTSLRMEIKFQPNYSVGMEAWKVK